MNENTKQQESQSNRVSTCWELKDHSYQITDTGDYDGINVLYLLYRLFYY